MAGRFGVLRLHLAGVDHPYRIGIGLVVSPLMTFGDPTATIRLRRQTAVGHQ